MKSCNLRFLNWLLGTKLSQGVDFMRKELRAKLHQAETLLNFNVNFNLFLKLRGNSSQVEGTSHSTLTDEIDPRSDPLIGISVISNDFFFILNMSYFLSKPIPMSESLLFKRSRCLSEKQFWCPPSDPKLDNAFPRIS